MKKITLLMLLAIVGSGPLMANEMSVAVSDNFRYRNRNVQPITFHERGTTFFIFPNGDLDFRRGQRRFRAGQRFYMNAAYNTRSLNAFGYFGFRRGIVTNRLGQVIRVGLTSIQYDFYGRVRRVGTVHMRYGKHGMLRKVGGLHVRYNRRGRLIDAFGEVKPHFCGICGTSGCSINHFGHDHHDDRNFRRHNDWDDDWNDDWNDDWDDDWDDDRKRYKRKRHKGYDSDDD